MNLNFVFWNKVLEYSPFKIEKNIQRVGRLCLQTPGLNIFRAASKAAPRYFEL